MSAQWTIMLIADAARFTQVPAGTIRRWLADGRLCRFGDSKPYRVDAAEVGELRDTFRRACASDPGEQS